MNEAYQQQVVLLLDVLPFIQKEDCFALKGGTAINLFYRDLPRLSVDIDLTYLPIEPRDAFLTNLTSAMRSISKALTDDGFIVQEKKSNEAIIKLDVSNDKTTIKIEPNTVLRGTVFQPEVRELCEAAQDKYFQSQKVKAVSFADLFAGKICAALDRQHPRDLFDIKLLFENEGITETVRQAFIVYLASCPRPMSELLNPHELDLHEAFEKEFSGMTEVDFSYDELCAVRRRLIDTIHQSLHPNEKQFLLSIKSGKPDWSLMPISHISKLPGIRWKVMNIQKMDVATRNKALKKLKDALAV